MKPPTKAEILITRACNLNCSYCAMRKYRDPKHDKMSDKKWGKVPYKLKELGVPFAPIYGAEPLLRLKAVKNFVKTANEVGIKTSVITNATLLTPDKARELKDSGVNSITVSYDGLQATIEGDISTKTAHANNALDFFSNTFNDVELVFTLTNQNFYSLIPTVIKASKKGIYTYFEFVHPNRAQEGSKCSDKAWDLTLTSDEGQKIVEIIRTLMHLKKEKKILLHNSISALEFLSADYYTAHNRLWKCTPGAWITIDQDGSVFGCDDYQPEALRGKYPILDYGKTWTWDEFVKDWATYIDKCPGCFWATHYMASEWYKKDDNNWIDEMTHVTNH